MPFTEGPAWYFPSIEKSYGKPVTHWFRILDSVKDMKHTERVSLLKTEHEIGHADAITRPGEE